jgi:hypothetical protein
MLPSAPASALATMLLPDRRALVSFTRETINRYRSVNPALLASPPIENGVEDVLPVVLQNLEIEVQDAVQLGVEHLVI